MLMRGLASFVMFFTILILFNMLPSEEIPADKLTAETIGTMTKVEINHPERYRSAMTITYEFVINGQTYQDSWYVTDAITEDSYLGVGKPGQVCYDPDNPYNSRFTWGRPALTKC